MPAKTKIKIIKDQMSLKMLAGVTLVPAGLTARKSLKRTLKLTEITKRLSYDESNLQLTNALQRILKSEGVAHVAGIDDIRRKVVTSIVAKSPNVLRSTLLAFVFEDLPKRVELAFSWLYEEYCYCHSFHKVRSKLKTYISCYHSKEMSFRNANFPNKVYRVTAKF